ncbi:MAG: cbb3-type cytochrome c oxidase subunit I, partial [Rhodobiaceae bacterium]|nr:cbb3-type cytochrome c oxidase subunit I [Rhodobiaceae bacterium]
MAIANTTDAVMTFHAGVGLVFALAGIYAIFRGYANRSENPPQTVDGLPNYKLGPVKFATFMSMFWGLAGFLVGLIIALQLAFPALNFDLPWTNFGRLRPLHTSAVIFAFGGNVLLA